MVDKFLLKNGKYRVKKIPSTILSKIFNEWNGTLYQHEHTLNITFLIFAVKCFGFICFSYAYKGDWYNFSLSARQRKTYCCLNYKYLCDFRSITYVCKNDISLNILYKLWFRSRRNTTLQGVTKVISVHLLEYFLLI